MPRSPSTAATGRRGGPATACRSTSAGAASICRCRPCPAVIRSTTPASPWSARWRSARSRPEPEAIATGLRTVHWPARLQLLARGPLADLLPRNWQLWLDGGHNPAAGQALAASLNGADAAQRPLHLIVGMLNTKDEAGFLRPLAPLARSITTVPVPDEPASRDPVEAAQLASGLGVPARPAGDVESALRAIVGAEPAPSRVLICGSLYLAGHVLRGNG